jgi:hypothetical protein
VTSLNSSFGVPPSPLTMMTIQHLAKPYGHHTRKNGSMPFWPNIPD